jgi:hypothetical protein
MKYFISCVDTNKSHPSSKLANRYVSNGYKALILYENSRSICAVVNDSVKLFKLLRSHKSTITEVGANVNGSLVRAIIMALLVMFGIKNRFIYLMDIYPGCLRFLTKRWYLYYPMFYLLELLSFVMAKKIIIIDEGFYKLQPLCFFNNKTVLERLFFTSDLKASNSTKGYLGIIGNISNEFIENNASILSKVIVQNKTLLATSNKVPDWLVDAVTLKYVPWKREDTNVVFNNLQYNLICADMDRLTYCSPSKIVDSYLRGITPVLFVSEDEFGMLKLREIYKYCITLGQFMDLDDAHNSPPINKNDLINHAQLWQKREGV